ncbi:helix-turn-helix domain-containing protein [Anaerotruncus colihominis]|uniref:XRE family transcriptional regulator n=1 Tax=Anaerotruncus colihominis TaxID=169435 RepID=A0A3E3ITW9_9FIRM|nr:helix-turn-helix transcriptional regulator [Anaerotruncus colihominis]RGE70514.1 XRE family transcriptional regulator [Anaerotruncus colihominis]
MNVTLTIQEKLKDLRTSRGLNLEQLAEQTGISRSALGQYETDEYKDISHTSIVTLAKCYGVSTDYLLGMTENKNHPNTDLAELHLSDEMIALLKSGQINTRLLCEMAAHKDFVKLLADIEIYVDGIAAMQIQNINAWVDVVRAEIIEKYRPSEQDKDVYLLQAAHVNEGEYFSQRVHEDIDAIMQDIKNAHRNDSTSAPNTTVAQEIKRNLEEVANFKGSRAEQLIMLFCKQTRLKYSRLTDEEKQWLTRIAQKSELLKSPIKQRGKQLK